MKIILENEAYIFYVFPASFNTPLYEHEARQDDLGYSISHKSFSAMFFRRKFASDCFVEVGNLEHGIRTLRITVSNKGTVAFYRDLTRITVSDIKYEWIFMTLPAIVLEKMTQD